MESFDNVIVFSYTTAEISQEYIDRFHEAEVVPNYLHELSQKAGVELVARDGVYQVKGSWLSVNRAHSFLGKFLMTYGETQLTHAPDVTFSKEEVDGLEALNRKLQPQLTPKKNYKRYSSEALERPEKTNEIDQRLPPDKIATPKSVQKVQPLAPEPVVLYAGTQSTKEVDSRRKALEVLQNVYKMEQNYQMALGKNLAPNVNVDELNGTTLGAGNQQIMPTNFDDMMHRPVEEMSIPESSDFNPGILDDRSLEMTKLKEAGLMTETNIVKRTTTTVKTLSKEETAAKRKKVESIAESILSNVPTKETVNVVSNEDVEKDENEDVERCDEKEVKKEKDVEVEKGEEGVKLEKKDDGEAVDGEDDKLDNDDDHDDSEPEISEPEAIDDDDTDENEDDREEADDKDYSGDTEVESADDEKKSTSDNEYVPENEVSAAKVKAVEKRTTRRSKKKEELMSLPSTKRGRGRPRKGFPMKLEIKLPAKKAEKKKKQMSGAQKRRGRPKRTGSESVKEYHCDECSYIANKRCHLKEHERRVHITKEYKCEHCDKIFGFGKDLRRHLKTHLKPQNCCDICGKMYKGMKSLVEHRRTHEDGYVKPEFECEICKKSFSTKYVLAYHIKSEHLGLKRTFMCPTCGKSFSQKNSYLQHANVHMGFKPYKCEICGKAFSYEKSLKEHRFMHDEIRRFKCTVCDKTFRQSSAVTIHMKVHKETKDYVCMACGKGFSQKQALIRHERIHLGEKPFHCSLCGRNFTDSSILRRHMILIHKKDPKKWREDTVNNTIRRTDFFIDVLPGMGDNDQDKQQPEVRASTENVDLLPQDLLPVPATLPATTTSTGSEPINMTTQSRERDVMGEFRGDAHIPNMEPDMQDNHHYHQPHVQQDTTVHSVTQLSAAANMDKMASMQNHSSVHHSIHHPAMPNTTHASHVSHASHQVMQQMSDVKSDAGGHAADYLPPTMSSHGMPYPMMTQGGYTYPQMVMLPDHNVQFTTPSAVPYQPQYPDQSTAHSYPPYHPPQS